MKKKIFTLIMLIIGVHLYSQDLPFSYPKYDPYRDAKKDLDGALLRAKKEKKHVLVKVGGEWCIWCRRLDSLILHTPELISYVTKHYVVVKINVSKENKNEHILSKYPKIPGYPHIFVLDSAGRILHSQNTEEFEYPADAPEPGYDKEKILRFLKVWSLKH
ncbi:MAG: thioredoxin family protein [Bacteroidetes bacterium]|nr:thioredoxin family protein [Bacteroidota bacterium]